LGREGLNSWFFSAKDRDAVLFFFQVSEVGILLAEKASFLIGDEFGEGWNRSCSFGSFGRLFQAN
jgi:hypothetical protein